MIETIRKVHLAQQRPIVFRVSPDLPGKVVMDVEADWGALSVKSTLDREGVLEIRDVCDEILQSWFCEPQEANRICPICASNFTHPAEPLTFAPTEPRQGAVGCSMICDVCNSSGLNVAPFHWIADVEQWECDACWKKRGSQKDGGFTVSTFTGKANDVPLVSELKELPKEERPGMNCEICGNRAIPAYYVHATWVCEKCNPARYKGSDDDILCKVDYKRTPDSLV